MVFRIHHTMLPVSDMDRSIDFYTRLLGMTLMSRRAQPARGIEVGHVGYGDRATHPSIELHMALAQPAGTSISACAGHIAIYVSDLPRLCAVLRDAGVKFVQPLQESSQHPGNFTAFVKDPDGHELELAQRT